MAQLMNGEDITEVWTRNMIAIGLTPTMNHNNTYALGCAEFKTDHDNFNDQLAVNWFVDHNYTVFKLARTNIILKNSEFISELVTFMESQDVTEFFWWFTGKYIYITCKNNVVATCYALTISEHIADIFRLESNGHS